MSGWFNNRVQVGKFGLCHLLSGVLGLSSCAPLTSPQTALGPDGSPLSCLAYERIFKSSQLGDDFLPGPRLSAQAMLAAPTASSRRLTAASAQGVKSVLAEGNASPANSPEDENILILSGGGEWGAYGAGFLNGLYGDPAHPGDTLRLRDFNRITGISTGAMMTPYTWAAIVHDRANPDDPQNPWLSKLQLIYTYGDDKLITKKEWRYGYIAFSNGTLDPKGRLASKVEDGAREVWDILKSDRRTKVSVGAVNAYDGQFRTFDLVKMVGSDHPSAVPCFREAILASSAIPLGFPPRFIDGEPYFDGGVEFLVYLDNVLKSIQSNSAGSLAAPRRINIRIIVNGNQSVNDPGSDVRQAVDCDRVEVGSKPNCAPVANSLLGLSGGGKGLAFRVTQDLMLYQLKKDAVFRIYNDWLELIQSSNGRLTGAFKFTYIPNDQLVDPRAVGAAPQPCQKTKNSTAVFDTNFEACLYNIGLAKGRAGRWDFATN